MKSTHRNHGGFTLVEILLVLGIIAILAIAAFIIFPQVQASSRANSEAANINATSAGIKNLFASTRDYSPLTNGIANQAHIFTSAMNGGNWTATAAITSSWGGTIAVSGANILGVPQSTAGTTYYAIAYTAVPPDVCTKLVPGLLQNYAAVYVSVASPAAATDQVTSPAVAVAKCAAGTNLTLVSL